MTAVPQYSRNPIKYLLNVYLLYIVFLSGACFPFSHLFFSLLRSIGVLFLSRMSSCIVFNESLPVLVSVPGGVLWIEPK